MYRKDEQLFAQIKQLKTENYQQQNTIDNLHALQNSLEKNISESNGKLVRAEMSSMELEQIFRAYSDAIWVVHENGMVVRVNEAMLKLLNKTEQQVIGQQSTTLLEIVYCGNSVCPLPVNQAPAAQYDFDIELCNHQGETRYYILATSQLITLDGLTGSMEQFKDITSRKLAETELSRVNRILQRMASIDGLTQLANRRCFDETLNKEWQLSIRNQKPLALLLGDIDYFKKYNDSYGHQAGDSCLQRVAETLAKSALRPSDLVARYGGEEFVLLLPDTDLEGAKKVADRVLKAITALGIPHRQSDVGPLVSISIGCTWQLPQSGQNAAELVSCADQALYRAKEQGRNRFVIDCQ